MVLTGIRAAGRNAVRLKRLYVPALLASLDTYTDRLVGGYFGLTNIVFEKMDEVIRKS